MALFRSVIVSVLILSGSAVGARHFASEAGKAKPALLVSPTAMRTATTAPSVSTISAGLRGGAILDPETTAKAVAGICIGQGVFMEAAPKLFLEKYSNKKNTSDKMAESFTKT